jgi:hypothetical protein
MNSVISKGIVAAAVVMAGLAAGAQERDGRGNDRAAGAYAIGLWGDFPYSAVQASVGVPNLIADMNAQRLAFSVHDGDLKTGNGDPICADALYTAARTTFDTLEAPAMFTPGDNDWTDCDRPKNGGFNSLERLTFERRVLFSTPDSMGMRRLRQDVQTDPLCLGVVDRATLAVGSMPCVENRRWTVGRVTYATLNIQGSCNNLCGDAPDAAEWAARNLADIAWMRAAFEEARQQDAAAVMFISQADPGFGLTEIDGPARDPQTLAQVVPPDGFQEFLLALRDEVTAFRKPVAYVHGDSHYFRVDKPLLGADGARISTFTRVETFGDHAESGTNDVNWVKVLVDPRTREVFAFQPQIVPGNRTAVPSPAR